MIESIRGRLVKVGEQSAVVEAADGVAYQVLLPTKEVKRLMFLPDAVGKAVIFYTHHYIEGGYQGGGIPRLVGFTSELEREFFEKLISVSGFGVRAAIKALNIPAGEIARAIEAGDVRKLSQLPKIGKRMAEKIVAALRGKVGKYALMTAPAATEAAETPGIAVELAGTAAPIEAGSDIPMYIEEARQVLMQLGYTEAEAEQTLSEALRTQPKVETAGELIQQIYQMRAKKP